MSDSKILKNLNTIISYKCIIAKKLINVVNYIHSLDIQKNELTKDIYIQLINDKKDFYKTKLYDYSNLYVNISLKKYLRLYYNGRY